jgi:hypothetical protein
MGERVVAEDSRVDAALIVGSHVIELERLAVEVGDDVADAAGLFIPRCDATLAAEHQSTTLVKRYSADVFAAGNQILDAAAGTAPVKPAQHHVAEVQPVLFVHTRALNQPVA